MRRVVNEGMARMVESCVRGIALYFTIYVDLDYPQQRRSLSKTCQVVSSLLLEYPKVPYCPHL